MTVSNVPGKVILLGEHAVVYGRPAIAVPLTRVGARAEVIDATPGEGVMILAPDLGLRYTLREAPADDPHAVTVRNVLAHLDLTTEPDLRVTLTSTIPIASGLGSGAAVATALVHALTEHLGKPLSATEVSALVYETEKLHHGTPSGIDNTVIAYAQPIFFVRGQPPQRFAPGSHLPLVVADSGVPSPTKATVSDVRRAWQENPAHHEALFDEIAALVHDARKAVEANKLVQLGQLMNRNHDLLKQLGVSSPLLDRLVRAAQQAGAWGAKLSGGGRGGNVITLVPPDRVAAVADALREAGAVAVISRQ